MNDKNNKLLNTCLSCLTLACHSLGTSPIHKLSTELFSIFSPTWAVLQHALCNDSRCHDSTHCCYVVINTNFPALNSVITCSSSQVPSSHFLIHILDLTILDTGGRSRGSRWPCVLSVGQLEPPDETSPDRVSPKIKQGNPLILCSNILDSFFFSSESMYDVDIYIWRKIQSNIQLSIPLILSRSS